jgi:hypothetical protein
MLDQHVSFKTLYTVLRMEEEKSLVHHKVDCPLRSTGSSFLPSIAIPSCCIHSSLEIDILYRYSSFIFSSSKHCSPLLETKHLAVYCPKKLLEQTAGDK